MRLRRCGAVPSAPPHDVRLPAKGQQEYRSSDVSALVAVCQQWEEGLHPALHLERAHLVPFDRACLTGQGRGRKLVTEEPTPVGSGAIIYSSS
jgi:hypothetical protein